MEKKLESHDFRSVIGKHILSNVKEHVFPNSWDLTTSFPITETISTKHKQHPRNPPLKDSSIPGEEKKKKTWSLAHVPCCSGLDFLWIEWGTGTKDRVEGRNSGLFIIKL